MRLGVKQGWLFRPAARNLNSQPFGSWSLLAAYALCGISIDSLSMLGVDCRWASLCIRGVWLR